MRYADDDNDALWIQPTGAALGADVFGVDISRPLSESHRNAIARAWADHLVLRFSGHRLNDAQLMKFSRNFGDLDLAALGTRTETSDLDSPEQYVTIISNVFVEGKPIGALGSGESEWHTDMSYNEIPPRASALYAIEVPVSGGNTGFCNMYAAYDSLPEAMRQRIEGLFCIHDASLNSTGALRRGYSEVSDPRQTPGARHPLVRVHPVTGRKCLFLGRRRNAYILGLSVLESEVLLDTLWAHCRQPHLAWDQVWRAGDLIVWDNRCTMHRREPFAESARRLLHRTQITGEPVEAAAVSHATAETAQAG
jgi:taurine dioxygenase